MNMFLRSLAYCLGLILACGISTSDAADAYVIGEEDVLQISVWGNSELNVHLPVRPDGMISMPLAGDVKAAGITPQELKKTLEKDLARFVKSPIVSVMVTQINSFKVYIFGEGISRGQMAGAAGAQTTGGAPGSGNATPGQVTLRRNTSLLQLLAQLGSLNDVDLENAYLLRSGNKLGVNFEKLVYGGDISQDVKLEPNDTIYLPGGFSSRIRVTGAVRTPGVFPYAAGMTALDAVLVAGGFTEFASQNSVIIVRKEGNTIKNIEVEVKDVMNGKLKKNVALKPGDVVTVKKGLF
jgi:polysaccharide biosynthesis/export protein